MDAAPRSRRKFLVIADDTPAFGVALRFARRRARSTGGRKLPVTVAPGNLTDEEIGDLA